MRFWGFFFIFRLICIWVFFSNLNSIFMSWIISLVSFITLSLSPSSFFLTITLNSLSQVCMLLLFLCWNWCIWIRVLFESVFFARANFPFSIEVFIMFLEEIIHNRVELLIFSVYLVFGTTTYIPVFLFVKYSLVPLVTYARSLKQFSSSESVDLPWVSRHYKTTAGSN